jgi:hypothetical protein
MVKPKTKSKPFKGKLPPRTEVFEKNDSYKLHRGFAFKVGAEKAQELGLNPGEASIVWVAPDTKSILTDKAANLNNARRRSSGNVKDSWRDLKSISPEKAKDLGWNGYQRLVRGARGSKIDILNKLKTIGLDIESVDQLHQAADGEFGENNGWGDSG